MSDPKAIKLLHTVLSEVRQSRAEILARVVSIDRLAVTTAQRLDRHVAKSGDAHRDLRTRVSVLERLVRDILRR